MLKRTPVFLRVVDSGGRWDALDQPGGEPMVNEVVHAYQLAEAKGSMHLNARDKDGKRCGGFYPLASYKVCEEQPTKAEMINTQAWQDWCHGHVNLVKDLQGVFPTGEGKP